jgi:hypothetical protein
MRQRENEDREAGYLRLQFVIVIQKHDIGNISRRERRLVATKWQIVGDKRRIQKVIIKLKEDLRSDPRLVQNGALISERYFAR